MLPILVLKMRSIPPKPEPKSGLGCSLPEFEDMFLAHADLNEFLERAINPSSSPMMGRIVDNGLIEA